MSCKGESSRTVRHSRPLKPVCSWKAIPSDSEFDFETQTCHDKIKMRPSPARTPLMQNSPVASVASFEGAPSTSCLAALDGAEDQRTNGQPQTKSTRGHDTITDAVQHKTKFSSDVGNQDLKPTWEALEDDIAAFERESASMFARIQLLWDNIDGEFDEIEKTSRIWLRDMLNYETTSLIQECEDEEEFDRVWRYANERWGEMSQSFGLLETSESEVNGST